MAAIGRSYDTYPYLFHLHYNLLILYMNIMYRQKRNDPEKDGKLEEKLPTISHIELKKGCRITRSIPQITKATSG